MEQEHPASMTARAVKKALPDRAVVTKDARVMMNTATSMFTLYLSSIAHDISTKNKRSTITLKDVLAALKETEFEHFIAPVEQCLADTKAADARKRARKEAQKSVTADGEAAESVVEDPDAPVADSVPAEQEEVPLETDADLDGEQTIDEEEDGDEVEDEAADDEPMGDEEPGSAEGSAEIGSASNSQPVGAAAPPSATDDITMEEAKGSED